ncbi:unnamed protein product, partial [Rotaria sp. Silwood1]
PPQYRLDARLARLLSISNGTRQTIIHALWQYIKTHKLQNSEEREYIHCDIHLQSVCLILNSKDIITSLKNDVLGVDL